MTTTNQPNPIPPNVWWCKYMSREDQMFKDRDGNKMGIEFYRKWHPRRQEFPQSPQEAETPSGEWKDSRNLSGDLPPIDAKTARIEELVRICQTLEADRDNWKRLAVEFLTGINAMEKAASAPGIDWLGEQLELGKWLIENEKLIAAVRAAESEGRG